MPEPGLDEGEAPKRVPLVSHTPHFMRRGHLEKGQGEVLLRGAQGQAFLPLSKVVYSTAEPVSCRHAWQRMAVPERSSFLGWAPNIPSSHRGSSMALVQMDLGKSYLLGKSFLLT